MNDSKDGTEVSNDNTEPTSVPSAAYAALDEVKNLIEKSGPVVKDRVVSSLAEKTINDRVALTLRALEKLNEVRSNLRKASKPDQVSIDPASGKKIELMSLPKFEEVKKMKEAIEKIEKALELALSKNDFSKLGEASK